MGITNSDIPRMICEGLMPGLRRIRRDGPDWLRRAVRFAAAILAFVMLFIAPGLAVSVPFFFWVAAQDNKSPWLGLAVMTGANALVMYLNWRFVLSRLGWVRRMGLALGNPQRTNESHCTNESHTCARRK